MVARMLRLRGSRTISNDDRISIRKMEPISMNMREKMARALCLEDGYDPDDDGGVPGVARWRSYLGGVDAALSAMEEPTEAMLDATPGARDVVSQGTWSAMLDAAGEA